MLLCGGGEAWQGEEVGGKEAAAGRERVVGKGRAGLGSAGVVFLHLARLLLTW